MVHRSDAHKKNTDLLYMPLILELNIGVIKRRNKTTNRFEEVY